MRPVELVLPPKAEAVLEDAGLMELHPELVRIALVRPKYETVDQETGDTRTLLAEPPQEMLPRGLLGPRALAHIIAGKWDQHVPYHRQARCFERSGYELAPSTLSGAAIRASPLAKDLVSAMEAEARRVAPCLGVDTATVLLQEEELCLRGYVWLRYIEDVCVLANVTRTHDSESAGAQLWGLSVSDGRRRGAGLRRRASKDEESTRRVLESRPEELHLRRAHGWAHAGSGEVGESALRDRA